MMTNIILNEKELREARLRIERLSNALATEQTLSQAVAGLPPEVVSQVTEMLMAERKSMQNAASAYEIAKSCGDAKVLERQSAGDAGVMLIVARIAKGYSQKELAWRLGIKEQQVQRYEADRYSSISLKNYNRIAALLGVQLRATIPENANFRGLDAVISDVSKDDIRKIVKHGRANGWFSEEMDEGKLRQYIAENRIEFGSPSLLRTGLNVTDHSEDVLLHAWRARVALRARQIIAEGVVPYDPIEIGWLLELVRLSRADDGPLKAQELLKSRGILLIAEAQIPGLAVDGAAFLEGKNPVVGLTLRRDAIDNFWFTLLHEIGHVILHYRTGLNAGFFDEIDAAAVDQQEEEADRFASNILIPEERWRKSTARIAQSAKVIENFAQDIGIHPAIVFGRIRKERGNYAIFSDRVGGGGVRKQLMQSA
jgi:HTH-type transcriptional regulator/antitoxin HigA